MQPAGSSPYELSESHPTPGSFVASGRREFFEYRDLGVSDATHGDFGFVVTRLKSDPVPTGWHYHECDLQIIYVMKGYVDLGFADGRVIHADAGTCVNIPSGTVHNELTTSSDFEVLELTSPSQMTTILVDEPAYWAAAATREPAAP